MRSSIARVEIGSRADAGSSIRSTCGLTAMARAMHNRCCWPPDKDEPGRSSRSLTSFHRFARAIAVKPQVLLMDEPASALDPISTLAIEDLIAELKDDYTIVIVTHNMQQAARVSDRTAFFNITEAGEPGRLVEMDETRVIFSTPSKKATEDYISGRFGRAQQNLRAAVADGRGAATCAVKERTGRR